MSKGGYGSVPGVPAAVPGYGNVPTGNQYGSVPSINFSAANAALNAGGAFAPPLDLPVSDFARAAEAGGYDDINSPLNAPVSAKGPAAAVGNGGAANAGNGGYDSVVFTNEQIFEHACSEAERANSSRKHDIWNKLYTTFSNDLKSRLAVPTGRNKQLSSANYMMEGIDPKHRMGDLLASCLMMYKTLKPAKPFFEWLDSKGEFEQVVLLREAKEMLSGKDESISPTTVKQFVRGVAYLDASTNGSYKITIANGKLYQNGKLFDTSDMSTVFSGKGHAIFVQSPKRDFYSASHKMGEFHHSSFLSGASVRSAGEWIVKQGDIKWLSAKSGHYKPEMYHYVQGIQYLKDNGAISAQTTARVYDNQGAMNLHAMTLLNPVEASKWSVWG